MWRLSISVEFGKDDPPREYSDTTSVTEMGPDPERRPIGFWPNSEPTRRTEEDQ